MRTYRVQTIGAIAAETTVEAYSPERAAEIVLGDTHFARGSPDTSGRVLRAKVYFGKPVSMVRFYAAPEDEPGAR
jgi:hypothetical protein